MVVKCSVAHTDDGLNIGNEDGMFITLPGAVSTRIKVMSKWGHMLGVYAARQREKA